jgi:DNA-binding GntR family transcriptional regulator
MVTSDSGSITRHRLNDQIASRIREEILSGDLRPGTRMVQSDWADRLGTSRMPVRDAFLRLQSEGLITAFENGIAHVADLSEEDIADAYTLNSVAAGMAAQRAAQRMSDETVEELRRLHAEFKSSVERNDVERATRANNAFHRLLTVESGSPRLIGMMRVLSAGTPHVGTRELPSWRERSVVSHEAILAAVVARDAESAARLMREHVLEAASVVIGYLRGRGFWETGGRDAAS